MKNGILIVQNVRFTEGGESMANKVTQSSAKGLTTLLYTGAAFATFMSVYSAVAVIGKLFSMWTSSDTTLQNLMTVFAAGNTYTDTILLAVVGVGMAVAAFFLYGKVSREVAKQPEYTNTTAYAFITNALVGVFVLTAAVMVLEMVSILISSLLLIGTSTNIGAMYLGGFLPLVLSVGVVGFAGWMAMEIMRGHNKSKLLTIVAMSVAGALLVAAFITVPIKAHSSSTTRTTDYDSIRQYFDY